ncbi:MAG: lysostaphin resistance A-like protein, partial [Rudaea sp.]
QNPQEAFLLPQGLNLPEALVMIVLVGFAGPFAEEILFRGVLYNWLRGRWGFIASAFASSVVFGVMHVEPSIAAATFVLGFIIAGIYEWSGSLWTAVLVHATNNTAVILILYVALLAGVKLP